MRNAEPMHAVISHTDDAQIAVYYIILENVSKHGTQARKTSATSR